jgi:DNA-binding Xre family transcriptional regulator
MSVSYRKLWKLLIDKKMKKFGLLRATKMSTKTLAKLSNDKYVKMQVLEKICHVLKCNIEDIVEIVEMVPDNTPSDTLNDLLNKYKMYNFED